MSEIVERAVVEKDANDIAMLISLVCSALAILMVMAQLFVGILTAESKADYYQRKALAACPPVDAARMK